MFSKRILYLLLILIILFLGWFYFKGKYQMDKVKGVKTPDYLIVMVGDSMTEKLGNSDELRLYLKQYYPKKTFDILNYGFGSTNILSVPVRLYKDTFHARTFQPILNIDFDLILIESFGNNPLSDYPLEEGLKKQREILTEIVKAIQKARPKAKIVFVATIAPSKERYGEGVVNLDTKQRRIWAEERIAYIKNHIAFAEENQIPLINIYQKSLTKEGDGNIDYLDTKDFIHPSPTGVYFISKEIADFIYTRQLFLTKP